MTRTSLFALATLAFATFTFTSAHSTDNPLAALAERDLESANDRPDLLKRTTGNVYQCSDNKYSLCFGSGKCGCKSSPVRGDSVCEPPRTSKCGVAKCSTSGGCHVECNAGMVFNSRKHDCECLPGYEFSRSGTYCQPSCDENEKWNGSECVCVPGCGRNRKNKCEPVCKDNEEWNGHDCVCVSGYELRNGVCQPKCKASNFEVLKHGQCVCIPGYIRENGKCHEECCSSEVWDGHHCVCKPGYIRENGKCHPKCETNEIWTGTHCMCKPGFRRTHGKCHIKCDKNEIWNGEHCMCKPGYHRTSDDKCVHGPSQVPHNPGNGNGHHHHGHKPRNGKRDAPVWSSKLHTRDQDSLFCPDGLSACPIDSSLGGYECVDTKQELENCGGCTSEGAGRDCTTIHGAAGVGCHAGQCVVLSCVETHRLSASGECIPYLSTQKRSEENQA